MYKIMNDFFVRYPSLPLNNYNEYYDLKRKKVYKEKMEEAILTTSQSLYHSMYIDGNCRQENEKLIKYLIRSCYRSTPFGLLAGVQKGKIDTNNKLKINEINRKKRVRPDMEWLIPVIKLLEKEFIQYISVTTNNLLKENENNVCKEWNSCYMYEDNKYSKKIIISNTSVIKFILKKCKNRYITTSDLFKELQKKYTNLTREYFNKFILNLIDKEFINSNLRISNVNYEPFNTIINIISSFNTNSPIKEKLLNINRLIQKYEDSKINEGIDAYKKLISEMNELYSTDKMIHIDMYDDTCLSLSKDKLNILEEFVKFNFEWSYKENYNEYIDKFQEKYGNQAVKYLDVINPDIGIGIPTASDTGKIAYNDQFWEKFVDLLLNSDINNNVDIDISNMKRDINIKIDDLPESIELATYLLKNDDNFDFYISPIVATDYGYKARGRFNYLFSDNEQENNLVELSFVPTGLRYTNVMFCKSRAKFYLEYGSNTTSIIGKERVDLNDIYMYIDENRKICFLLKSTNQKIKFVISNMINRNTYPKEIQYLYEIQRNQQYFILSLYSSLMHFVHHCKTVLPRIKYKNIILFPKTWKIPFSANNLNFNEYSMAIYDYMKKYNLPNMIVCGLEDRRILLNLTDKRHLKMLYDFSKKNDNVLLYENLFSDKNSPIIGNIGNYIGEFIFNFSRKIEKDKEMNSLPTYIDNEYISNNSKLPFEDWISLKLYFEEWEQESILVENINKYFRKILLLDNVENAFFIRYKDPESHIRLRIKIKNYSKNILELLQELINELKSVTTLNKCIWDTYIPEINRYGGLECIAKAEEVFCSNSILDLSLIENAKDKSSNLKLEDMYLISAYKILLNMELTDEEILQFLNQYNYGKKSNKEFKTLYSKFGDILNGQTNFDNIKKYDYGVKLLTLLDYNTKTYKEYYSLVKKNNNLTECASVVCSILHMHFNRLIGINRGLEYKLTSYLRKIVYINYQRKLHYE